MRKLLLCGLLTVVVFAVGLGTSSQGANRPLSLAGRCIVDQSGHQTVVEKPFRRIISLYGAHTENLFALGCADAVIGVGRHHQFPAQAREKPVFHYREDAERFLAARPDLVLIRPMIASGCPQLVARLRAAGITVVSLQPNQVEEMFLYWRILGVLTGREKQAEAMILEFREQAGAYRSLTAPVAPKKRVYFEAIHAKMKTFAPGAMALFVLECAGGVNVAAEATSIHGTHIADFGQERILALGDRIDVYLAQVGPMNRPTLESIRNESGFQAIKAVREGNLHLVDEALVSRPTMRLLQGIAAIAAILYPERFPAGAAVPAAMAKQKADGF